MKQTKNIMGMHITIEVADENVMQKDIDKAYEYFTYVDEKFSTYKETSEISKINNNKILKKQYSSDMKKILLLCEQTKKQTKGYFDIYHKGLLDPSGLVKGWAIQNVSQLMREKGFKNFYIDAGGDIQTAGKNSFGQLWKVGIRNPFHSNEIIKIISAENKGIATSGTQVRGQHIYNPHKPNSLINDIVSLTVIAENVYEADRFATAGFAMGKKGIYFFENLSGFEAYMIDNKGIATYTSRFNAFLNI